VASVRPRPQHVDGERVAQLDRLGLRRTDDLMRRLGREPAHANENALNAY
jgi:hypothetical protein